MVVPAVSRSWVTSDFEVQVRWTQALGCHMTWDPCVTSLLRWTQLAEGHAFGHSFLLSGCSCWVCSLLFTSLFHHSPHDLGVSSLSPYQVIGLTLPECRPFTTNSKAAKTMPPSLLMGWPFHWRIWRKLSCKTRSWLSLPDPWTSTWKLSMRRQEKVILNSGFHVYRQSHLCDMHAYGVSLFVCFQFTGRQRTWFPRMHRWSLPGFPLGDPPKPGEHLLWLGGWCLHYLLLSICLPYVSSSVAHSLVLLIYAGSLRKWRGIRQCQEAPSPIQEYVPHPRSLLLFLFLFPLLLR